MAKIIINADNMNVFEMMEELMELAPDYVKNYNWTGYTKSGKLEVEMDRHPGYRGKRVKTTIIDEGPQPTTPRPVKSNEDINRMYKPDWDSMDWSWLDIFNSGSPMVKPYDVTYADEKKADPNKTATVAATTATKSTTQAKSGAPKEKPKSTTVKSNIDSAATGIGQLIDNILTAWDREFNKEKGDKESDSTSGPFNFDRWVNC